MIQLTIQQRVDLLLKEGVDKPEKWVAVKEYEGPAWHTNTSHGWAKEWRGLFAHHQKETGFLFDVIRELISRIEK